MCRVHHYFYSLDNNFDIFDQLGTMSSVITFLTIIFLSNRSIRCSVFDRGVLFDTSKCSLEPALLTEIRSYKAIADQIFNEATQTSFKHKTYKDLRYFVNTFGSRPNGDVRLERSLNFLQRKLRGLGMSNVHSESVRIPKLIR